MRLRTKVIKGARDLVAGQIGQQGLAFARNLIIARLVSPEDYGIAATFVVILSMFDAFGDIGTDRFIIQARDGDDPAVQSTLQLLLVIKGVLLGICLLLSAELVARLFGKPEVAWAYRWLALVPIVKGFVHLDLKRLQRKLNYRKEIAALWWSQVAALIAAILLGLCLRSYAAVLWSTVVQVLCLVTLSHVLCERRYQLRLSTPVLNRILAFGWPLLLNGMLLFATSQGDKLLVGTFLGVEVLGLYAVAALIPVAVGSVLRGFSASLFLPVLSGVAHDRQLFGARYDLVFAISTILAIIAFVPLISVGHIAIPLFFGSKYSVAPDLIAWLAIGAAVLVLRATPTIAALAIGDTKGLLYANIVRICGFAVALMGVQYGSGAVFVATSIAMGELLATSFSIIRLNQFFQLRIGRGLLYVSGGMACCFGALAHLHYARSDRLEEAVAVALVIVVCGIIYVLALSRELGRHAKELAQRGLTQWSN